MATSMMSSPRASRAERSRPTRRPASTWRMLELLLALQDDGALTEVASQEATVVDEGNGDEGEGSGNEGRGDEDGGPPEHANDDKDEG